MRRNPFNLPYPEMLPPASPRYTQLPSYELCNRRPCLDDPEDHAHVLRKARIEEGVSFCEPIKPDYY